jgi:glycogen(starch) synthase
VKLLVYSHFFPPSVGGVETVVLALAHGLSRKTLPDGTREFEITLVTQTPSGGFQDADLPFQAVRQPTMLQLCQLVRHSDVVHVAGAAISPIAIGLLMGKPVVVEHHGFQTICPTGQLFQEPQNVPCPGHFAAGHHAACLSCSTKPQRMASLRLWLLTFLRRFLCQRVAVNITPTAWLATQLQLPRAETVPHGLPIVSPIQPQTVVRATPVIVFMGRLVTTKGLGVLLEAARILIRQNLMFELRIIGEGPERLSLEEFAHQLALDSHVQFLGRLAQGQVSAILAQTDLVVVPSLGGEVFGMVVAENMLRGLTVVASDLGAFQEVLGNTGVTFRTGNAADLAAELGKLLDDPTRLRQLGAAARQRVLEFFTLGRMIKGHAEVYRRIVPRK